MSSSVRPSTTNDKENLPSIDKQYRPSTAAVPTTIPNDHSLTNGGNNSLLASASMDTSTSNSSGHTALKTSTSGVPTGSNAITNRTNPTNDKYRAQTVRLPNTTVRRRDTLDPVPSGSGSMKKNDSIIKDDKTKPSGTNVVDR